jgi:FkbM family methyltransferase
MDVRNLAKIDVARRVAMPLFARLNPGDITIRHHWTGDPITLHSFRHRGYWFHGRRREMDVMDMLLRLLCPGDHVLDVGGHIGYFSAFFADLVGPGGRVDVFEPGRNNLPYLTQNTHGLANVVVHPVAVAAEPGTAEFFLDDLTGQNNSLGSAYAGLQANARSAHTTVHVTSENVPVIAIDSADVPPVDAIKIDIEGGELNALQGASQVMSRDQPLLMVEVTDHPLEVRSLLAELGYLPLSPGGQDLTQVGLTTNVFALSRDRHAKQIRGLLGAS